VHIEFWWGNLRVGDHLKDPGVDGRILLKMDLPEVGWEEWTGSIWLRIDRWRAVVNAVMNLQVS
jgi:hypothetical protein